MPLHLILRNLLSHPIRALLTLASILVAVFLLCVLRSLVTSLGAGIEAASSKRLVVQSAVSLFVDLPQSYQPKIASVPGVDDICKWQWFGGVYQDRSNFFAQFGVDADNLLTLYPEMRVMSGTEEEFQRDRGACIVGKTLVEKFGWKVGETVPLMGTIFSRTDGKPWEFKVAAVYESSSPTVAEDTMYFHYEYLRESLESGSAVGPPGVGVYVLGLSPGARPEEVMRDVDALFENGPQRVQTTTEAEFARQFVSMLGNLPTLLGSIGSGVFFAIVLAALNTMLMAGRERTRDIGIMKAMGFGDGTVFGMLLVESLLLCGLGGLFGVGAAVMSGPVLTALFGSFLPGYGIGADTIALGLGVSVLIGFAAGVIPAWRASRLEAAAAIRAVI